MKNIAVALAIHVVIWVSFLGGLYIFLPPVQAAPAADGDMPVVDDGVVMCVKTATTGDIDFYYCEPSWGPSFVANSVGFMELED